MLTFGTDKISVFPEQREVRQRMVGRVIIIDGQAANRVGMKARLAAAAYDAVPAADGAAALSLARTAPPDAVLVSLDLPGPPSGIDVLRQMRADRRLGRVPLIGLDAGNDIGRRIAALDAGADDVLTRPFEDGALFARLRNLMRQPEPLGDLALGETAWGMAEPAAEFARPGLVAILSDRPEAAVRLRNDLSPLLPHRCFVMSRGTALADAGPHIPDVFLIDGEPGGTEGSLSLMAELRSRSAARHAGFCLIRPVAAGASDAVAYDMGAHDITSTGADLRELALRVSAVMRRKQGVDAHRRMVQEQLRLSVRDPLTGLHNRRYALNQLAGMAEAARMESYPYAVMILDLDRFKEVNDRHGHAAGDAVLVAVGERLHANIRSGDILARHGGEEFLIALPRTDLAEASAVADRLCQTVQEAPFDLPREARIGVTASVGLAMGGGAMPVRDVIERADRALFAAKAGGRNCVRVTAA